MNDENLFVTVSNLKIWKCWEDSPLNTKVPKTKSEPFIQFQKIYSSSHKSWIFCFAQLLLQILVNYQNQGQIWKLLVLTFSKHPLHVQFDQVLAEIFEVKDTWYHSYIFMIIDLTERKTIEIWSFCVKINWLNILDLLMVILRLFLLILVPLMVNRTIFGKNYSNLCNFHP